MVRAAGYLPGRPARVRGRADRARLRHDGHRGDGVALLRRHGGGPLLRHGAAAGGAARHGGTPAARDVAAGVVRSVLRRPARLRPLLHADPGADERNRVPPDGEPRPAVPGGSRARDDRLDRGGPGGGLSRSRGHRATPADRGRGVGRPRGLLPRPAAHAAREGGDAGHGARRPRPGRAAAPAGALLRGLRGRFVPRLHPAAVLLHVRQSLPERDRGHQCRRQDDSRTGLRDRLHGPDAVAAGATGREAASPGGDAGLGPAVRPVSPSATRGPESGCSTAASSCTASATTSSS